MPFSVQLTDDAARDLEEISDYVLVVADGRRDMQTLLQRRWSQA